MCMFIFLLFTDPGPGDEQHLVVKNLYKSISAYIKRKMALIVPFFAGSLKLFCF